MLRKIKDAVWCYVFGHQYQPIKHPETRQIELLSCECCGKEVRL